MDTPSTVRRSTALDGSGTEEDPYIITTLGELRAISDEPDAFYELGSDVDASDTSGESGFDPISGFSGQLDGKGYQITGLTIEKGSTSNVGLFADVTGDGVVKSLRIVDAAITGGNATGAVTGSNSGEVTGVGVQNSSVTGNRNTGGLVGTNSGTISQSFVAGSVESTANYDFAYVGGLVGFHDSGTITESFATATVDATDSGRVGGLVGESQSSITDCYATGDVAANVKNENNKVGGLIGENNGTTKRSFAAGIVAANGVGGFTGNSGTETDCYWDVTASGVNTTAGNAAALTTSEMQGSSAATNLSGFDFGSVWATASGEYPVLQSIDIPEQLDARPDTREPASSIHEQMQGDGSAATPYVVTSVQELQAIDLDRIAFYELGTDIDASETTVDTVGWFGGDIDGQGNQITGLTVEKESTSTVGLFKKTLDSAEIRSLRLVDATITGGDEVGAVVGYNRGNLNDVGVRDSSITGRRNTGGLVGTNDGSITLSFVAGSVESTANYDFAYVGGLVGFHDSGLIQQSFATTAVDALDAGRVGGLVGESNDDIFDCYATGDVAANVKNENNKVGGLIGENNGTTKRSFAAGIVAANGVGGFTGNSGTETDCYWDVTASGVNTTAGNAAALTTGEMQGSSAATNLSGFDFGSMWNTTDGEYPVLENIDTQEQLDARPDTREPATSIHEQMQGDGSAATPYVVTSVQELQAVAEDRIAFYELGNDIDASQTTVVPIDWFGGELDGQGSQITGLSMDLAGTDAVGLFKKTLDSGSVRSLRIADATITGGDEVGALAGYNRGTLTDVGVLDSSITGRRNTGGLVGTNDGTLTYTFVAGSVESTANYDFAYVGGLVGFHHSGLIQQSFATATVDATDSGRVGGLVGESAATVTDSYATGDVAANLKNENNKVGGLIGEHNGTVKRSFAAGIVAANGVGGFTGNSGTETNCYWDVTASGIDSTAGSATARTTGEMQGASAELNLTGFDFQTAWETVEGAYPVLQSLDTQEQLDARPDTREPATSIHEQMQGDGSAATPYVVTGVQELQAVAEDRIAFYELGTDIDASQTTVQPADWFGGDLDGQGNQITGLSMDLAGTDAVGLFKKTLDSGAVRSLRIVDATITGRDEVGALAGYNRGTLADVGVLDSSITGRRNTGGLVGTNDGTISQSFVTGSVESTANYDFAYVGGLVGYHGNGLIERTFTTVTLTGPDAGRVGGFAGESEATIRDCYATGSVTSDGDVVAGFIGEHNGTTKRSFTAAEVSGSNTQGFTGNSGTETDCYWDTQATGQDTTAGDATARTTGEMQGASAELNLTGFDFDSTWQTVQGAYPTLQGGDTTLSTDGPKTGQQGGEITLTLSADYCTNVTVKNLWTDWTVTASGQPGGAFNDNVSALGEASFQWNTLQPAAAPTLTISLPERYAGGTYALDIVATSGGDETVTETTTISIES